MAPRRAEAGLPPSFLPPAHGFAPSLLPWSPYHVGHRVSSLFQGPGAHLDQLRSTGHCPRTAPSLREDRHHLKCGAHLTLSVVSDQTRSMVAGAWCLRAQPEQGDPSLRHVQRQLGDDAKAADPELLLREGHPLSGQHSSRTEIIF